MVLTLAACGSSSGSGSEVKGSSDSGAQTSGKTYKVGICNYVDDASLNQIVDNIETRLEELGKENGIRFEVLYDNCMADAMIADKVDAIFTPTDNTIMTAELSIYEKFAEAGIPHYTGADSFALNGAFLGYGVDYANLGVETADMIADILLNGKDPAKVPVKTFDNGTATINTEIAEALGYSYDELEKTFAPFCTKVQPIETAESFDNLN